MPNPVPSDLRVDSVLTSIAVAFIQEATDFVAARVFPTVGSDVQSDRYVIYNRADFFRNEMQKRAPGTESAGGGFRIDNTPTFYADVWALHHDVDDQRRRNQRDPVDLDRDAAMYLAQQGLIRRDKEWVSAYFATGVWDLDRAGVSSGPTGTQFLQWDQAASTPITDIRSNIISIKKATGFKPNKLVLGAEVWGTLQDHSDFLDRIKYTERGMVSPDLLAAVLELDEVLIASGVEVTSEEGAAADTFAFIAGKNALLVYAAPNPGLQVPSGGYTFAWEGLVGSTDGTRVKSFRMEEIEADRVEIEMAFDMKKVSGALGVFYSAAIA